jgi:hypothetical protein
MTASCAASRPISPAAPPRLDLPEAAARSCSLATLPPTPTQADLETAYAERGAQIVTCDAARRLAIDVLIAERALVDQWLAGIQG